MRIAGKIKVKDCILDKRHKGEKNWLLCLFCPEHNECVHFKNWVHAKRRRERNGKTKGTESKSGRKRNSPIGS
jgi:hypothetical protein